MKFKKKMIFVPAARNFLNQKKFDYCSVLNLIFIKFKKREGKFQTQKFKKMKKTAFLVLFFVSAFMFSQTKILSWNIENLGQSKTDKALDFIATTIKDYDVIAVQEVVASPKGSEAIANLVAVLNRKGSKWDYTISDATGSTAYKTERYAFIWKTSTIKKVGDAWLEKKYADVMDRDPYLATFKANEKQFTLVSFHAITKTEKPETEIQYFSKFPEEYPNLNLIFMGDFNCPQSHKVFDNLRKIKYKSALRGEKTSLKRKCNEDDCLASEYDNIYFLDGKIKMKESGKISFHTQFKNFKEAHTISDHLPIWMAFSLN